MQRFQKGDIVFYIHNSRQARMAAVNDVDFHIFGCEYPAWCYEYRVTDYDSGKSKWLYECDLFSDSDKAWETIRKLTKR